MKPQSRFAGSENFEGVSLKGTKDVNGALIHDVGVVYGKLPRQDQERFGRELAELVSKYLPLTRGIVIVEYHRKRKAA